MKSFLVFVFVVGCVALAGQQHAGGILHGDGSYVPGILMSHSQCQVKKHDMANEIHHQFHFVLGSALVWAGIARNSMRYSDPVGYHLLQYWFSEIEAFNRDMERASDSAAILNFLKETSNLFGRLQSHVKRNLPLAHRFAITHSKLEDLFEKISYEERTVMDVNNYLIDAYPKFISALNSR